MVVHNEGLAWWLQAACIGQVVPVGKVVGSTPVFVPHRVFFMCWISIGCVMELDLLDLE